MTVKLELSPERVDQTHGQSVPLSQPQLQDVLNRVRDESRREPEKYLDETHVKFGGE